MTREEFHKWVGAAVGLIGSLGWLHESYITTYGNQVALAAHQQDTKEELSQQRADMRTMQLELANCRHGVGTK